MGPPPELLFLDLWLLKAVTKQNRNLKRRERNQIMYPTTFVNESEL